MATLVLGDTQTVTATLYLTSSTGTRTPADLTDCTVQFLVGSDITVNASVVSAVNGQVSAELNAQGEGLDAPADLPVQWLVTYADNSQRTFPASNPDIWHFRNRA